MAALKEKRQLIEQQRYKSTRASSRIGDAVRATENASSELTGGDEMVILRLVESVKVLSAKRIAVHLKGGGIVEWDMENGRAE